MITYSYLHKPGFPISWEREKVGFYVMAEDSVMGEEF